MRLTELRVKHARSKDKPLKISDGGGLFLLVQPNRLKTNEKQKKVIKHGAKYWRLAYRFEGKQKLLALGVYPDVSLLLARERREASRKLLARGVDPSKNRKAIKKVKLENLEHSFEVVARKWLASYMQNKAASYREKVTHRFERYLFPWLDDKPITDITSPQILEAVKRIEELGSLETAHRTLQACRKIFKYAVQTGRVDRDVTVDLRGALPPVNTKHMASLTEPREIAELLRAIDGFKGTFTVQCALKIVPMLFVRPGELRMAKWEDIDLDKGEWRFIVSRTKTDHLVPLPKQAVAILRELHSLSGHRKYVFRNGRDPKKAMSAAAINAALSRMGYDTRTQITGHGFRIMARTILYERLNIDSHIIEHQLAHRVPDVLGQASNRTKFIKQRKTMMQQWADYLDKLKDGA